MTSGSRNLIILGVGAIVIAVASTAVSLTIYHNSGDIYLDRSRPGYLPDKDEVTQENASESTYTFADNGPLTAEDLEKYLEEYSQVESRLKDSPDFYSPDSLSDESLGIPSEFVEDPDLPLQVKPNVE